MIMGAGAGVGALSSSMGESGGGGMLVPSVREKVMGLRAGSSKGPLGLPIAGIIGAWLKSGRTSRCT